MPLDIAEASDAPCGHDKRFGGVFFAPKGTGGCVACAYEQAAAERDALAARLAEAEATNRHRDRQIAAIVTWLEQNQLDVFRRGLWDVIPRATDSAGEKP